MVPRFWSATETIGETFLATLTLIRGLPGSGKTSIAKSLPGVLVEADQFHTAPDGTYRYDGSKAGKAHKWCLEETERLLKNGHDVIVANVFGQRWQIRAYYELAEQLGVQVATLRATGEFKNSHDVPSWVIDGMSARWQISYDEPVTLEGNVVSVPVSMTNEVVFRLEIH